MFGILMTVNESQSIQKGEVTVVICYVMLHMTETVRQNWNSVCSVICCLRSGGLEMNSDSPQHNDDPVLALKQLRCLPLFHFL